MIIFLDLDGVIHNFNKALCRYAEVNYFDPVVRRGACDDYHYFEKLLGNDKFDKMVVDAGSKIWEELEYFSWSFTLYEGCVSIVKKENVFFLSSYGKFFDAASVKARRMKKDFNTKQVILTKYKYLLAGPNRVLIDDKPKNISEFEAAGGTGILWPSPFLFLDSLIDIDLYLNNLFKKLNELAKTQIN